MYKKLIYTITLFSIFFFACNEKTENINKENISSFSLINSANSGINFQNNLKESPQINVLTYQYFHNGAGVSIGDLNNDDLPDVYFVSNLEPNKLYLNKGDLKFDDISKTSNTSGEKGWANSSTMIDINNDGFLDIYVCKSGNLNPNERRNKLYINNGDLTFTEQAKKFGLDDSGYSTQAYFLDFDKDGDLDMYLLNHSIFPVKPNSQNINLKFERDAYAGDKLFENKNGFYIDISEKAGIKASPLGYGLSASIGDVNNDSYPDIYVCNDYMERDYLYINNGDGTFSDKLIDNTNHISNFSMGSDIADINNDGNLDIMIADMAPADNYRTKTNMSGMNPERFQNYVENGFHYQYMVNTLQLNKGDGSFSEIAQLAGVDKTDWSWAPLLFDYNNDGTKDLFVSNGLRKEARNNDFLKKKQKLLEKSNIFPDSALYYMKTILDEMPQQKLSNYLFKNDGKLKFEIDDKSGIDLPSYSNGAAYADLDLDGDLDLIVNNIDSENYLCRNNTDNKNYLKIKLIGNKNNINGIGAKVKILQGNQIQTIENYTSRGYLSSVSDILHFGLQGEKIDKIEVTWTDGKITTKTNVTYNDIEINYLEAKESKIDRKTNNEDLKTELKDFPFKHQENEFDDFKREVLLPHKMSMQGPTIAVGDINNDGFEDVYIGGAKNQSGQLFIQSKDGEFTSIQKDLWTKNKASEETESLLFDYDNDGDLDLYIGNGGNEYRNRSEFLKDKIYINNNGIFEYKDILPNTMAISTGSITPLDFDQDGDLDLFIGNRQTPGTYPKASKSYLLENIDNKYSDVTESKAIILNNLGMLTNSYWADLDGDKQNELVIAGEWMPITILSWNGNTFENSTKEFGLNNTDGFWFGLNLADIDKDGDLDLIAGNLGLNYKYKASKKEPFQIYSKDFNEDGKNDIVLSYTEDGKNYPVRGRQCSSQQIPEIKNQFKDYNKFALATTEEIYDIEDVIKYSITDFSSALFINDNGKFIRENFKHEWQYFNWSDILIEDINNDGDLDLICAGNLYEAEVETPRCDAGNGLILLGNGDATFTQQITNNLNWGNSNVKDLEFISIQNRNAVIIGTNNGSIKILEFLEK